MKLRLDLTPDEQSALAGVLAAYQRIRGSVEAAGRVGEDLGGALEAFSKAFGGKTQPTRPKRSAPGSGDCKRCRGSGLTRNKQGKVTLCGCARPRA